MRMHTLLTKAASVAVCFGILLSGPASAFGANKTVVRDVELSANGTLYGQVFTSDGRPIENAAVELRHQGNAVARTATSSNGEFAIEGVRGGAHEVAVGSLATPVRLWQPGTAPAGALKGLAIAGNEQIVRGQYYDEYGNPIGGPIPVTGGFGLIDCVTLAMVGTSIAGLVIAIDNNNKIDDLKALIPASP